jgi:hypothetical protein
MFNKLNAVKALEKMTECKHNAIEAKKNGNMEEYNYWNEKSDAYFILWETLNG